MKYLFLVSYFTLCCYALFWVEIKPVYNEPTCNSFENQYRKTGKRVMVNLPPSVFEWNMLMRRSGQILIAKDFVPESVLEQGVFFSNLCKSLLNDKPFPSESAIYFFEFCFDKCPQLDAMRDRFLYRYKTNISNNDSTIRIIQELKYLSNIEYDNPEFRFGALIDIIASVDTVSISSETFENLIDHILDILDYKILFDSCGDETKGCDFIKSIFKIANEIDANIDKHEQTTIDLQFTTLKVYPKQIYSPEQKQTIYRFVAEAKRMRMEIVGF